MRTTSAFLPASACALLLAVPALSAQPRLFYSDLESGPNSGGENNGGAFVTIYGGSFGATRGRSFVTIGSGRASAYSIWTDTRITFQLGNAAATGSIVVNTPAGASAGIPFRVRTGNLYFVASNGSDGSSGRFGSPWRTLLKARDSMAPGDITYAMDGVRQVADDGQGWSAAFTLRADRCGGPLPRALIAYPGATVTIGDPGGPNNAIRGVDSSAAGGACAGSWVFAGLTIRGPAAFNLWGPSTGWRIVGNDISCPTGNGASGCIATARSSHLRLLGNRIHDAGKSGASALYQGVYIGTDSNNVELGWNTIAGVRGCRGVQVYSHPLGSFAPDSGGNLYGLSLHDNVIHDTQCDGIVLYTVDPSRGKVEVYNNVIYNAGLGNTPERTGNWSCINVVGGTNYGPAGGGTVDVFNNTLYNCGANASPPYAGSVNAIEYGGRNPALAIRLRNNIIYQRGVAYVTNFGSRGAIQGSNNLFFGAGPAPSGTSLAQSLNADPQFVNAAEADFHLLTGSPARRAGVDTGLNADLEGTPRRKDSGFDLGAFQYSGSEPVSSGRPVRQSVANP
jgi:hypothetical protein